MRKLIYTLISAVLLVLFVCMPMSAAGREYSYTYNSYGDATTVSTPYYVKETIGEGLNLNSPKDIKVYEDEIYILDAGNKRIVVVNKEYKFLREIILVSSEGQPYEAKELTGIFLSNGNIYTVDRTAECIVKSDLSGKISKIFYCPQKAAEQDKIKFIPTKCVVDGSGYIYILLENEYRGFMVLDAEGNFSTYYGSAKVTLSADILKNTLWRNFMTEEQIANTSQYVPGGYSDVDIDKNGFIYATKGISESKTETICKLNAAGNNILVFQGVFGDTDLPKNTSTEFISVSSDDNGFIAALDKTGKKIFRYTPQGELMYVFGGEGDSEDLFKNPSELCYNGEDILVVDADTSEITVFAPHDLTTVIDNAQILYSEARFTESKELWSKVIKESNNYELALVGLGKVYESEKDYVKAMEYYRRGGSKLNYSSAFEKQRSLLIKKYFTPVFLIAAAAVIAFAIIKNRLKKAGKLQKKDYEHGSALQYVRFAVLHPFDGFSEFRYNKKDRPLYALVIVFIWFLATCLNYNYDGYVFNTENPEKFNLWIILASTVGLALLFTLSEWLLGTFFEGKGTFSQILCGVCYSLIPSIIGCVVQLVMSNVLSADETFFVIAVKTICTIWTLFLIFIAMKQVNQYSYLKNALTAFCAILGVLAVVFLVVLFFNLWVQLSSFCSVIVQEIVCRIESM